MASGTTFGNLRVTVQADTSKFSKGIKKAQKDLTLFQKTTRALSSNFTKLMGGLSAGLAAKAFVDTAQSIDELSKSARGLNLAVSELQSLRHAAQLSGLSNEQLASSLKNLTRNVTDAANGTGEAQKAFQRLNIDAKELLELPIQAQLGTIFEHMNMITNATEKSAMAQKIWGRSGVQMLTMAESGFRGLIDAQDELEQRGALISDQEAQSLEKFNDEVTRLKETLGAAWTGFVIDIAPAASDAITALDETFRGAKELIEAAKKYLPAARAGQEGGMRIGAGNFGAVAVANRLSALISGRLGSDVASRVLTTTDEDRERFRQRSEQANLAWELRKNREATAENTDAVERQEQLPAAATDAGTATATIMK